MNCWSEVEKEIKIEIAIGIEIGNTIANKTISSMGFLRLDYD